MSQFLKISTLALAAAVLSGSAFAQDQKEGAPKGPKEKSEEIIIRKNGNKTEKMTIVVDGDKVTINGKPADEFNNDDVTVQRRNRSLERAQNIRRFQSGRSAYDSARVHRLASSLSNKAVLGILTQKADNGVKINDVSKESSAEKAGLKKDDVITKVGNKAINSPAELIEAIGGYNPNDKVDIAYLRDGKENKTTAILGQNKSRAFSFNSDNDDFNFNMPDVRLPRLDNFNFDFNRKPKIGLQIQDVEEGKGVKVRDVDEDSPASKTGIKEGDVITQLNGKEVAGVDELRSGMNDLKEGDVVKLGYKRDGKNQTAEIKIPKRLKSADL